MPFHPGQSGNPAGRPKGSIGGRSLALRALDELLTEEATLAELRQALREELRRNPVRFFRTIVMPLLPREAAVALQAEPGSVQWVSLLQPPAQSHPL